MDFISSLPESEKCGSIIVVVDRFSKYATFIGAPRNATAVDTARLFMKNIVKHWGIPKTIVSDRDPRFTGKFWYELFKLLGSNLALSTSFHPQTDGQTERVNALLELYLRHYVSANQKDWAKLLDIAQFSYNLQRTEATGRSPFEMATGRQPLTPQSVVCGYSGQSPAAYNYAKSLQEETDLARATLDKAAKKMKKWADLKRRAVEFKEGDLVMIKLLPLQFSMFRSVHKGLLRRYEGPFPIKEKIGTVAYRLILPERIRIHPVFHVSQLKPFHEDKDEPERSESNRAPMAMVTSFDKGIEEILADRPVRQRGVSRHTEYLVHWKGQPQAEASWEREDQLWQFKQKIEEFHATKTATRALPK